MSEICSKCGLPKDLCVCETIAKAEQKLVVSVAKRRFGKFVTLVEGLDPKNVDLNNVSKTLKTKFACGGTIREGSIELQGDHRRRIKDELVKLGFPESSIEVK